MATSIANKDARCIALAGPTASGKTAAALAIASRMPVEIISVDSALVYREMDIGTAKPTPEERAQVPHHLIDIRDPLDAYSAAEFVEDATRLIDEISSRGKTPLLTGGTMLYFKALFDGLDAMPKADPEVREEIEQQAADRGWPQMHYELSLVDPTTAERLNPTDSQRIQRALEVFRVSGRPLSSFHTGDSRPATDAAKRTTLISLEPATRKWLHDRIEVRFDTMLEAGLVHEVEKLRARGDLTIDHPSMRCVGYRQTWEVLDGTVPMKELRNRGIFATRQLAKRQLTWLRSMPNRQVIACDDEDALDQVVSTAIKATGQKKS